MNLQLTALYCLVGFQILWCAFVYVKLCVLSCKLKTLTDFMDARVFSPRFHKVIGSYFADEKHVDVLLDNILPVVYAHMSTAYTLPTTSPPLPPPAVDEPSDTSNPSNSSTPVME